MYISLLAKNILITNDLVYTFIIIFKTTDMMMMIGIVNPQTSAYFITSTDADLVTVLNRLLDLWSGGRGPLYGHTPHLKISHNYSIKVLELY